MDIRACTDAPPGDLLELLAAYPFKEYQKRYQGADGPALAAYHHAGLLRGRGNPDLAAVDSAGRTLAFVRRTRSAWHSDVLGVPFWRLGPLLVRPREGEAALEPLLERAVEGLEPGCVLEHRADVSDHAASRALAALRFQPIGTSVKLSCRREDLGCAPSTDSRTTIRAADAGRDLEAVQEIVRTSHVTSHFFNQPAFSTDRVEALFSQWAARCMNGLAEEVLVAERDGQIAGFITILVNRGVSAALSTPVGVVDFVAVSRQKQGMGVGGMLIAEGLRRLARECRVFEIRTELDNFPAIRAYQRIGFRITSADHVWNRTG